MTNQWSYPLYSAIRPACTVYNNRYASLITQRCFSYITACTVVPRPVEYQLHCFTLLHRPGHGSSHGPHNGGLFTFTEAKEAKFILLTMVRI